ncbi:MAG: serine/threonine protein kinase [Microthrixaceae bacterium]|nr:serine/threonine protein kinase [Microthrixaceae bacterium]
MDDTSSGQPMIPGYRDLELIGRGGFAAVYRAHDDARNRTVAIKVLTLGLDDPVGRSLFDREAKGAGSLSDHPHIVTLYDSGFLADGRPYLVMEHCPHGSVRVAADEPASLEDVLELGVKLAGALATAHARGILHRDVKPENVLVTQYHEPALCDFGIASMADRGDATTLHAMTPTYAAPEVLDLGKASEASDLYSLGATLYRLLAGRPPFGSATTDGLHRFLTSVVAEPLPPIGRDDVPAVVEDLLRSCMAKSPADRPASAEQLGRSLQEAQRALGLEPTRLTVGTASMTSPLTGGGSMSAPDAVTSAGAPAAPSTREGDGSAADSLAPPPPSPSRSGAADEGERTVAGRRRVRVADASADAAADLLSPGPPLWLLVLVTTAVALVVALVVFLGFR